MRLLICTVIASLQTAEWAAYQICPLYIHLRLVLYQFITGSLLPACTGVGQKKPG
jgi:hypothetical protein